MCVRTCVHVYVHARIVYQGTRFCYAVIKPPLHMLLLKDVCVGEDD